MTTVSPPRLVRPEAAPLSETEFAYLRSLVESRLGISLAPSKRSMLETRLRRRLNQLKLAAFKDYCRLLEDRSNSALELQHFLDLATTNKTSFFREQPQLESLAQELLPEQLSRARDRSAVLRVWSAACSSGQEVWTLVMLLDQAQMTRRLESEYFVLGSDVCGSVLQTAIAAKYPEEELVNVPAEFQRRYFMRSRHSGTGLVRLTPAVRERAGFFQQNLMDAEYRPGDLVDVLLLRNALIYFSRERQVEIVRRTLNYLRVGGLFVVSLTESLNGFGLPLTHLGRSIYRRERT